MLLLTSARRLRGAPLRRLYHDESFGYRAPRACVFPDYTPAQLSNRAENAALLRYVDSVRTHGHRAARIDPLDLIQRMEVKALDPTRYGLVDSNKKYNVNGIIWTNPNVESQGENQEEWWTLDEITRHLRLTYVGRIAYEYMHSPSKSERLWFSHHLESNQTTPPVLDKKRIHGLLARSEVLDNFLQLKFPNLKRYGLEGGESMLPALDALFSSAVRASMSNIILAMPHRGRLNLLTDLLAYSPTALFHKIRGGSEVPEELGAEGDVLSHLVSSTDIGGVKVSLLPNPSHLEAVAGVALGKTRAKQYSLLKTSPDDCMLGDRVMCVQLHGDASFTGQGVVMESLGLSNLPHFTSGGTVHLVVDNNIGYTTPASHARSSMYCSDIGKMINAPVLHVNGDHPEDVVRAMDVAFRYRQYFRKDIIVDLLVYRRWGHNELDLPSLTSPLMYEQIAARRSVPQLYEEKLINEQVISAGDAAVLRDSYKVYLNDQLAKVEGYTPSASMLEAQWRGIVWPASSEASSSPSTGVDTQTLINVGEASVRVPSGFEIHPKLQRHIKNRLGSLTKGTGIDWASAEALAFGSLLMEGYDVRISGQDVGRGTFSQRHAMLVDQTNEGTVVPLNDELKAKGKLELANSSLSEMAVLSFEYGASWERPDLLPIWEAQFGDFFNGAQIIIDTFITSSETKWLKQSGIVMLLPHGLDGAGPEHSSSRIERMLQLSNDRYSLSDDIPNTNERNYRKPLIVAGPKGLLRLSAAASSLSDMGPGTSFQPVLSDDVSNPERIIFLTGKIYYDLIKERHTRGLDGKVAFVRIEELSPFPFEEVRDVLQRYGGKAECFWLQEEPRNQGAWGYESALPAPGVGKLYKKQQEEVLGSAFMGL
ncbi:dehydrogenase E1 and transketolase domain-containing protein 1 [Mucidula mucida]|nr:dehydrogenase E1 and transketolase domain-containing protein 1 [Mucidula mucida]